MTDAFQKEFHAAFNAPEDKLTALVERMMNAEVTRLKRVTEGYVNEVYRAELASAPSVFVRIKRRGGGAFDAEAWALDAARRAGVPAPVVYAVTTLAGDEPLEVMILEAVPGQALGESWLELSEPARSRAMSQVGGALRSLHNVTTDGWGRRAADGGWEGARRLGKPRSGSGS